MLPCLMLMNRKKLNKLFIPRSGISKGLFADALVKYPSLNKKVLYKKITDIRLEAISKSKSAGNDTHAVVVWDNALNEIYTIARECLQECFLQQAAPTSASEDTDDGQLKTVFEKFSRPQEIKIQNATRQQSVINENYRAVVTTIDGDCAPHTLVLSLLYSGLFQNQPRDLIVQILRDWYVEQAASVCREESSLVFSDHDFKNF